MKFRLIFLTLIIFSAFAAVFAQGADEKWKRLESDDKEFSFTLPANFIADAEERKFGQKFKAYAFQNGVEMEFEFIRDGDVRNRMKSLQSSRSSQINVFSVGEYTVLTSVRLSSAPRVYHSFWIAKKDVLYFLKIVSQTGQEKEVTRFVNAIRLNGKSLIVQKENTELSEEVAPISSIKTSPEISEAMSRKIEKNKGRVTYEISSDEPDDTLLDGLTRKVLVVEKPLLNARSLFNAERRQLTSFVVRLGITFLANGQIGDITVMSATDKDVVEACVEAARKIRFVPAQIKGENTNYRQIVSYTVSIF